MIINVDRVEQKGFISGILAGVRGKPISRWNIEMENTRKLDIKNYTASFFAMEHRAGSGFLELYENEEKISEVDNIDIEDFSRVPSEYIQRLVVNHNLKNLKNHSKDNTPHGYSYIEGEEDYREEEGLSYFPSYRKKINTSDDSTVAVIICTLNSFVGTVELDGERLYVGRYSELPEAIKEVEETAGSRLGDLVRLANSGIRGIDILPGSKSIVFSKNMHHNLALIVYFKPSDRSKVVLKGRERLSASRLTYCVFDRDRIDMESVLASAEVDLSEDDQITLVKNKSYSPNENLARKLFSEAFLARYNRSISVPDGCWNSLWYPNPKLMSSFVVLFVNCRYNPIPFPKSIRYPPTKSRFMVNTLSNCILSNFNWIRLFEICKPLPRS